jgi:hypothetical protein
MKCNICGSTMKEDVYEIDYWGSVSTQSDWYCVNTKCGEEE